MSIFSKSTTITAEMPHVKCDKDGCDKVISAGGVTTAQEEEGWIVCRPIAERPLGAVVTFDPVTHQMHFNQDDSKHLCPKHAQLFAEFVNAQ